MELFEEISQCVRKIVGKNSPVEPPSVRDPDVCLCGKKPELFSPWEDMWQITCSCGVFIPCMKDMNKLIDKWNIGVKKRKGT